MLVADFLSSDHRQHSKQADKHTCSVDVTDYVHSCVTSTYCDPVSVTAVLVLVTMFPW